MTRAVVLIIGCFAIAVAVVSAHKAYGGEVAGWATLAASLAVVASLVSAWAAGEVVVLQRAATRPYVYPSFDLESRYGLVQLKVTNYGGSVAHDVTLQWKKELKNKKGNLITFSRGDNRGIPVLLPGESVSTMVGGSVEFFRGSESLDFPGVIRFSDATGHKYEESYIVSGEKFRDSLQYDQEMPRTHYEIQKIPGEIAKLTSQLKALERYFSGEAR